MTAHEALWLIKAHLQKTEQNLEAVKVLSDIVAIINKTHIDDAYGTEAHPHNMGYDDETAYQLYGTEAQHFKNHMAKVAERDLKKYKTDEEDTQSETSLNHMFGDVEYDLSNLKLVKFNEPRSCARYDLAEEEE
jgi:hypothetical protein